jgi:integrase
MNLALAEACKGLEIPDRMTTHRLRHTCDIIRWVQKRAGDDLDQRKRAAALVKRLRRIRDEVGDL